MGETFSSATPSPYPITGQAISLKVQCFHNGEIVDLSSHNGFQVTSDWTSVLLQEALEQKTGVHRICQTLMFAGKTMDPRCTIRQIVSPKSGMIPERVTLFMHVDREIFPQMLGPCMMMNVPCEAGDFTLPELTEDFKRVGFYWEMKASVLECYGFRASAARIVGQVSPAHRVHEEESLWCEVANVPPDAVHFAWSYPVVDWERVESDAFAMDSWVGFEGCTAFKSFLTVGGFLYIDAMGHVVGAATLGPPRDANENSLEFLEAKRWNPMWTKSLAESGRFQPVTMRSLVDAGAALVCWLRPKEVIEGDDGQPLPQQPEVPHGGFAYLFHDDVMSEEPQELAVDRYFPVFFGQEKPRFTRRTTPPQIESQGMSLFRQFSTVRDEDPFSAAQGGTGQERTDAEPEFDMS